MHGDKKQTLIQKYGIESVETKTNWRDHVQELKNLNVIHNDLDIPEEYRGYPGIVKGTISGSLSFEDGMVKALKHVNYRTIPYIVNINDFYDEDIKQQRLDNSKKLYELFRKEKI